MTLAKLKLSPTKPIFALEGYNLALVKEIAKLATANAEFFESLEADTWTNDGRTEEGKALGRSAHYWNAIGYALHAAAELLEGKAKAATTTIDLAVEQLAELNRG